MNERLFCILSLLFCYHNSVAQEGITYDNQGKVVKAAKKDSLQHRDPLADSITISYRYAESSKPYFLDSSIDNISTRFPIPYTYINLGNYGTASRSLVFKPIMKAGFDEGFHQYDLNNFSLDESPFFQTTRPYTELAYLLGSQAEQFINTIHTQNRKPNLNFSFAYRFSNAPGIYQTQNASHNNIRATVHYEGIRKRYECFFVLLSNKNASSENGGIRDLGQLDSLVLGNGFEVNTRLGNASTFTRNPFNTTVNTGNIHTAQTISYLHHYDFGQSDSIVHDTVTIHLFYPRFRVQHQFKAFFANYTFKDLNADSTLYSTYFNFALPEYSDTIQFTDKWNILTNNISLISFPEKNNLNQFLLLGIGYEYLKGTFGATYYKEKTYYNIIGKGEYRNKTRNGIWDIDVKGELYLNGMQGGDYNAFLSLERKADFFGKGSLQVGFQNTNRTPSFIFNNMSSFPFSYQNDFKKENLTRFWGMYQEKGRDGIRLLTEYFGVNNYAYSDSFFSKKQYSKLFNVLHINIEKGYFLTHYIHWHGALHIQQASLEAPVSLPTFLTENRISFDGNFFRNLYLSSGFEISYYSGYHPYGYSPFTGQFYYQQQYFVSNRPTVNLFFDFRIKTFKGFLRVENLNTLNITTGSFSKLNYTAQYYPQQGVWIRFGIWWTFIN